MQVKVCPKCKAQCRPTSAACSSCYTSLEAVPVTEGTAPVVNSAAPAQPRPVAPRPPAGGPPPAQQVGVPPQTQQAGARPPYPQQVGAPQQTQMGYGGPPPGAPLPPGAFQVAPKKSPVALILVIVFVALIAIGGIAAVALKGTLFASEPPPKEDPVQVMHTFLDVKKTLDYDSCKPYLSAASIEFIDKFYSGKQFESAGFDAKQAAKEQLFDLPPSKLQIMQRKISISQLKEDKEADSHTAIVQVTVAAVERAASSDQSGGGDDTADRMAAMMDLGQIDMQYVLIAEGGHWKIDIPETNRRCAGDEKQKPTFKLP